MNNDLKHEIWLLARNCIYDLEQTELRAVREKLRKIMELSKDGRRKLNEKL